MIDQAMQAKLVKRTPKGVASQYPIAEIRVKELERVRRVHVSYRKDGYLSPAGRRLIEILKTTVKKTATDAKP